MRAVCSTAIVAGMLSGFPAAQELLNLQILEPTPQTLVVGAAFVRVSVPTDLTVAAVDVFVDGSVVPACSVRVRPFECRVEFGNVLQARTIRAVATLGSGARLSTSIRTATPPEDRTRVDAVLVPFVVTDRRGRFVQGVTKEAVTVLEDGVPQVVTFLQREGVPLDIVLALDVSSSMRASMTMLKASVKALIRQVADLRSAQTPVRVTIVGFNERAFVIASPDASPEDQMSSVDRLVASGGTSLYDATRVAADLLALDVSRKAIVVFTDGDDRTSFSSIAPLEARLRDSDATLYAIVQAEGSAVEALDAFRLLAERTGGRAYSLRGMERLQGTMGAVVEELANQYLLGYSPSNTAQDGRFRRITVQTSDRSARVRAREGYRGQRP